MTTMQQFERAGDSLLVRAPAKLNLSLLIAGKRADGFHELETIMAKIDWHDELLIGPAEGTGIELSCRGPEWAPQDQSNLVYRAAREILDKTGIRPNVRLQLVKNIPAGTGLGSASSDAAAALMGLNRYLDLHLPRSDLLTMASRLGSDVAFFLGGPLALCTGKGEKIRQLAGSLDFRALVIVPNVTISTKKVYENYTHDQALYERWARDIAGHIRENRIDLVAEMCANMLERTCFKLFEELGELKETVASLGVRPVCLSGSGSAMFHIADQHDVGCLEMMRDQIAENPGCRSLVVENNPW